VLRLYNQESVHAQPERPTETVDCQALETGFGISFLCGWVHLENVQHWHQLRPNGGSSVDLLTSVDVERWFQRFVKSALTDGLSFQAVTTIAKTQPWQLKCINWGDDAFAQLFPSERVIDPGLMVTMGVIYVDCPTRAQAALHVRSAGYPDLDPGNAFRASHAHRHFSEYQHPRGEHYLEFHWYGAG
jgi:hypothetical protein